MLWYVCSNHGNKLKFYFKKPTAHLPPGLVEILHCLNIWITAIALNIIGFLKFYFMRKVYSRLPHSLEKVIPILVLQFENYPLFCGKTLTFQLKTTPFSQ